MSTKPVVNVGQTFTMEMPFHLALFLIKKLYDVQMFELWVEAEIATHQASREQRGDEFNEQSYLWCKGHSDRCQQVLFLLAEGVKGLSYVTYEVLGGQVHYYTQSDIGGQTFHTLESLIAFFTEE